MRTILGRLADLGLPQLLKLLVSSGAEGRLELDTPHGRATLTLAGERIGGDVPPGVLLACRARAGTFRFEPADVGEQARWSSVDEIVAALDAVAPEGSAPGAVADPLDDLRASLGDVELPDTAEVIGVATADPRPYRAMELDWRARGWRAVVAAEPGWPGDTTLRALVVHLPTSVTLVGQESVWLELAVAASTRQPPVPVVWVGGLNDPWLRHQAVMAGVSFLLPAPVGEAGETARWFREEVTAVLDRLLSGRVGAGGGEAEAFREFFFALHMDASPAEARASLLRVAGAYFGTGLLVAVGGQSFDSLGSYGLGGPGAARLPRGVALLEDAVERCLPAQGRAEGELATVLGADASAPLQVMPVLVGPRCVALFVGARPRGDSTVPLRDLMARSGSLLGL